MAKTRNGKNCISATAEAEKMPQKRHSNPLEARKAEASTEFT